MMKKDGSEVVLVATKTGFELNTSIPIMVRSFVNNSGTVSETKWQTWDQ